jgi:hypothetical protein
VLDIQILDIFSGIYCLFIAFYFVWFVVFVVPCRTPSRTTSAYHAEPRRVFKLALQRFITPSQAQFILWVIQSAGAV